MSHKNCVAKQIIKMQNKYNDDVTMKYGNIYR